MKQLQPRSLRVRRAGLFLLVFAIALPGCASIANFTAMRSIPTAGPDNPVRDIACIWQQGEGRDERGRPCRGFCGQLMFLTAASKKPGIVRGTVELYVFDNIGAVSEQSKPIGTFKFNAEEWSSFQRLTNLGMTYQLFIPYTRPGGHDADCQIHVKFTPEASGTPFWSHPETIALRGSTGPAAMANALDQRLTSSSPLFSRSTSSPQALNAEYSSLLKKLQEDAAAPRATPRDSAPAGLSPVNPGPKQAEIERLQAILEASTSTGIEQAGYAERSGRGSGVSQAAHEEQAFK